MAAAIGRMQLSIFDKRGNKGSLLEHVNLDDAQTVAQVNTAIALFATNFATVSGAGIKDGSFTVVNPAATAAAAADSDISSGALLQYDNATDPTRSSVFTPSYLASLIVGNAVNQADALFIAWDAYLRGAVLGGHFANSHYVNNRNLIAAFLTDRERKRRR
jgi:hypothetical protein